MARGWTAHSGMVVYAVPERLSRELTAVAAERSLNTA
jgi:hypothetical protein